MYSRGVISITTFKPSVFWIRCFPKILKNRISLSGNKAVFSVLFKNYVWPVFYQTPISNRQEKFLCCFCCKSGPITAMLRLDRIGFVLGESIPFQAEIQNMSKRACTVQMNLIMVSVSTITYVVQTYNGTCSCCTNDNQDLWW